MQCATVRLSDCILAGELLGDPLLGAGHRTLVEPEHHAEGEEVLRQLNLLAAQAETLACADDHRRHWNLVEVVALQALVLQRIFSESRLAQVDVVEGVGVHDDRAARHQVTKVHLECRWVHGDEHVGSIARRMDVTAREADLESRDSWERSGWRANLGGVIRQGGDVVAEECGGGGELRTGQLHSIARVAGEANRDAVKLGNRAVLRSRIGGGHVARTPLPVGRLAPRPGASTRAYRIWVGDP